MAATARGRKQDVVEEFRRRLGRARQHVARLAMSVDEDLASLDTPRPGDVEDSAASDLTADVLARLDGRARHELDEIDAAQARLAAGVFGRCERCGGAIPLARLRARPTARHCITCQSHEDRTAGA